jgi:epoxide hydrolase-like predicted phosphatase
MIKAVIFDFGRVISAQKPSSLFRTYENDLGLEPHTINTIMFDSPDWQDTLMGRKTEHAFWEAIGPALGLNGPEKIETFRRRYYGDEALNHGVLRIIRQLHGHYKLAVLSNSPAGLDRWLDKWKILNLFYVVFCSGDEGLVKPDPTVFQVTLERLGIKPEEAVFIDDDPDNVAAARKHGLRAILFTGADLLAEALEDLLVPE